MQRENNFFEFSMTIVFQYTDNPESDQAQTQKCTAAGAVSVIVFTRDPRGNFTVGCIHSTTESCVKPENVQKTRAEFVSKYKARKMIFCVALRSHFKTINLINLSWL